MTRPNFLMVGAAKAGTTAMYHYMRQHPDIFMPVKVKEPMFFCGMREDSCTGPGQIYARGKIDNLADYEALFDEGRGRAAIGEASVPYLYYHAVAIPRIREVLGTPKIIISLRHPVDRAYSNYLHHVRDGVEPLSFPDALAAEAERREAGWWWGYQYRDGSRYVAQVADYLQAFGADRVHITLYDDLRKRPVETVQEIFRFLGVDDTFTPDMSREHNVSLVPKRPGLQQFLRKPGVIKAVLKPLLPAFLRQSLKQKVAEANMQRPPRLDDSVRRELTAEFRDEIIQLQALIQRDLSHWLE